MRGGSRVSKREFLRWLAGVAVAWAAVEAAGPSLRRVNMVLLAAPRKAKGCKEDTCTTRAHDSCVSDKSGDCAADECIADSSGNGGTDRCTFDAPGDCGEDRCVSDGSGPCSVADACVRDDSGPCGSDACRDDRSPDCPTSDTCALDLVMGPPARRAAVASGGLGRALRWLYGLGAALALAALGLPTHGGTVIDHSDAVFIPEATFTAGAAVSVPAPVGRFLRDADGDGILEADVNGDGSADGDLEVKDYDGDGTKELPPGTPFAGEFQFTCFWVPPDVAIVSTGPLTVRASVEVAVFGVLRLASGIEVACVGPIDTRTSVWIADQGAISLTTALPGDALDEPTGLVGEGEVAPPDYVSPCDAADTTVRRAGPLRGTLGTEIVLLLTNAGRRKGKVTIGTAKTKVLRWGPNFAVCAVKKAPKTGLGTYALAVQPKEPRGTPPLDVTGGFDVRGPGITTDMNDQPAEDLGAGEWIVRGLWFGVKRGRITLDGRRCRVTRWTMNRSTGESEATFVLPAGLLPGTSHELAVTNKLGSATGTLDLPGVAPEE